jgi:hypothetical protein
VSFKTPTIKSSAPRQGERHPKKQVDEMKRRQRSGSEIAISKKPAAKPSSHQRDPKN